jgi:hypothetical protein
MNIFFREIIYYIFSSTTANNSSSHYDPALIQAPSSTVIYTQRIHPIKNSAASLVDNHAKARFSLVEPFLGNSSSNTSTLGE